jgi:hypothetical protein
MTRLKLIPSKTVEEQIEEINLPNFEINENFDENWFTETIKQHEEALKVLDWFKDEDDTNNPGN